MGWGEGFSASWTKVAGNCMKGIDSVSEFFPFLPWGVLFGQLNQSCWKLHEMDIQSQNFFFLWLLGGGGDFSASWTKIAGNYMKGIDSVSELFPSLAARGGSFSASWTKVAGNCIPDLNLKLRILTFESPDVSSPWKLWCEHHCKGSIHVERFSAHHFKSPDSNTSIIKHSTGIISWAGTRSLKTSWHHILKRTDPIGLFKIRFYSCTLHRGYIVPCMCARRKWCSHMILL